MWRSTPRGAMPTRRPSRIEAVVDHLRGGLGGPGHAPHGLRIGLEDDVDLGRAHRLVGVGRIVAGHRLQEDALRQAHALVFGELLRGHDLAARDAGHVRDDGLDFGDAVVAEELSDFVCHGIVLTIFSLCAVTRRLAELGEQRRRKRIAHHLPFRMPLHRERERRRRLHAERLDQPVGARALRPRGPAPSRSHALPVQRVHA